MDLAAKPLRQLHRCRASTSPAHYEHVADFSGAMKKVNFCQVNRTQESGHSRCLGFAQDLIDLRLAGNFFRNPRVVPLPITL
jgi:hypothetical protein